MREIDSHLEFREFDCPCTSHQQDLPSAMINLRCATNFSCNLIVTGAWLFVSAAQTERTPAKARPRRTTWRHIGVYKTTTWQRRVCGAKVASCLTSAASMKTVLLSDSMRLWTNMALYRMEMAISNQCKKRYKMPIM